MGAILLVLLMVWTWRRVGTGDPERWQVRGAAAVAYWAVLAAALVLATFSFALWIVGLPIAIVMAALAHRCDPTRAWLMPVLFGIPPAAWIASGTIDADPVWLVLAVGVSAAGLALGLAFELRGRQRRLQLR